MINSELVCGQGQTVAYTKPEQIHHVGSSCMANYKFLEQSVFLSVRSSYR